MAGIAKFCLKIKTFFFILWDKEWLKPKICNWKYYKKNIALVAYTDYGLPKRAFFSKISNFCTWADIMGGNVWRPLYPTPKYLIGRGISISIWATKNLRFSLRVSVVRGFIHFWATNDGFKYLQIVWCKKFEAIEPDFTYLLQGKMELCIISGQNKAKVATV